MTGVIVRATFRRPLGSSQWRRRESFYFEKSAISRRERKRQNEEGDIKAHYQKPQGEASTVG